jgi:hypothetical protein
MRRVRRKAAWQDVKLNRDNVNLDRHQSVALLISNPISARHGIGGRWFSPIGSGAIFKVADMTTRQSGIVRLSSCAEAGFRARTREACEDAFHLEAQAAKRRREVWKAPANADQSGVLHKYADQVGPARGGAVTYAGGKAEVVCYADM